MLFYNIITEFVWFLRYSARTVCVMSQNDVRVLWRGEHYWSMPTTIAFSCANLKYPSDYQEMHMVKMLLVIEILLTVLFWKHIYCNSYLEAQLESTKCAQTRPKWSNTLYKCSHLWMEFELVFDLEKFYQVAHQFSRWYGNMERMHWKLYAQHTSETVQRPTQIHLMENSWIWANDANQNWLCVCVCVQLKCEHQINYRKTEITLSTSHCRYSSILFLRRYLFLRSIQTNFRMIVKVLCTEFHSSSPIFRRFNYNENPYSMYDKHAKKLVEQTIDGIGRYF